jgi:hypothetical protein
MRAAFACLGLACAAMLACAGAPTRGGGRTVFVDAVPQAAAIAKPLEKQLEEDGYRIVRGAQGAEIVLRIERRGALDKTFSPLSPGAYTLTVVRGRFAGKKITSLDETCRGLTELPSDCHAETFLRELRDTGVLK